MKANQIVADAILYWDPSNRWARGGRGFGALHRAKVLDPTPRHWAWDAAASGYKEAAGRALSTTYGVLVEIQDIPGSKYNEKKVVTLGSLRGPYDEISLVVAEARKLRLATSNVEREAARAKVRRQEDAIRLAANHGLQVTGLYPGDAIQVPIEQFEALLAGLERGGWRYLPN